MQQNDKKPDSHVAYGAAMEGVSAVSSSVAVVGRYWWNIQMQLLQKIGIMPIFRAHGWLFFVVGFLLLALLMPVGVAFVVSAFCAGTMNPRSEDDYIVPLRQINDQADPYSDADLDRSSSPKRDGDKLMNEEVRKDLYVAASLSHMAFLNGSKRDFDDEELSATALGSFDGTVQALGVKINHIELHNLGAVFIFRRLNDLDRLNDVDPERLADLTTQAMSSDALAGC